MWAPSIFRLPAKSATPSSRQPTQCGVYSRRGTSLKKERDGPPIRIWALLGARAGDNDQVLALAEALGVPFETKQLHYNGLRRLGPKLLGRSFASLSPASRGLLESEPPPDVTISVGHRSVPVVRLLRKRSHGRMRSIHIGFPRVSPGVFDLLIATPQYPNPDHPHVLRIPFALTRVASGTGPYGGGEMQTLPSPRHLLIIGGPTSYWQLDPNVLRSAAARLIEDARRDGGSLLVTSSPRTPNAAMAQIEKALTDSGVPYAIGGPGKSPSYASMLSEADTILVTADSVAMVSDAIWTGKPLGLLPLAQSPSGKVLGRILDAIRPGRPRYPRDLRFFWLGLSEGGLSEKPSRPSFEPNEWKRRIVERARAVIEGL